MKVVNPLPHRPVVHAAVEEIEEEFLALVCADEELLRAEFEAIIAEEWGTPGPPDLPRRSSCPGQPPQDPCGRTEMPAGGLTGPQQLPAREGRCSQRGPPPG